MLCKCPLSCKTGKFTTGLAHAGTLPALSFTNLKEIWLDSNNFHGMQVGRAIQPLLNALHAWDSAWFVVSVDICRTGPLPPAWSLALQIISAADNVLTGSLPDSWHQLPALRLVRLANNMLNGANLRFVYVGAHVLTCAKDSNKVPLWLCRFPARVLEPAATAVYGRREQLDWRIPAAQLGLSNLKTHSSQSEYEFYHR